MTAPTPFASRNLLLQAMPSDDYALLEPHLRPIALRINQVILIPNVPISQLCFVSSGFVSITGDDGRGKKVEIGVIGREGVVGSAPLMLGTDSTPHEHFVQAPGDGLEIDAGPFLEACAASDSLRKMMLRYIQCLLVQTAQLVFVNGCYGIEARLASWLLMCQDRLGGDEILLTHDFVAMMLGVRRTSVTLSLQSLEGAGLIRSGRVRIAIRDRPALIALADRAYGVPEAEYRRLIAG